MFIQCSQRTDHLNIALTPLSTLDSKTPAHEASKSSRESQMSFLSLPGSLGRAPSGRLDHKSKAWPPGLPSLLGRGQESRAGRDRSAALHLLRCSLVLRLRNRCVANLRHAEEPSGFSMTKCLPPELFACKAPSRKVHQGLSLITTFAKISITRSPKPSN